MPIRRPDTPLASTVFSNAGEPKQTPKQRQDSIASVKKTEIANKRAKLDAILAEKRAESAKRKAKSDSIQKVRVEQFAQRAKDKGLTVKEYSKKVEDQKKTSKRPGFYTPNYGPSGRGRNPCPGNVCKK
jgi:hypothetical protein